MKTSGDNAYESKSRDLLTRIGWENYQLREMQAKKEMHMSVLVVHPKMRANDVYVHETGEHLRNDEKYGEAYREVVRIDKACQTLDICIKDAETNIYNDTVKLENLKVDELRSKVKAVSDKQRADQFFALPNQKGKPEQLKLFQLCQII